MGLLSSIIEGDIQFNIQFNNFFSKNGKKCQDLNSKFSFLKILRLLTIFNKFLFGSSQKFRLLSSITERRESQIYNFNNFFSKNQDLNSKFSFLKILRFLTIFNIRFLSEVQTSITEGGESQIYNFNNFFSKNGKERHLNWKFSFLKILRFLTIFNILFRSSDFFLRSLKEENPKYTISTKKRHLNSKIS